LNAPVIERWRELHGLTIYDGYGQTENTLLVGNFLGVDVRPGSMGKPAPGCDVRIIDEDGNKLPPGEPGDIALSRTIPRSLRGTGSNPTRPKTS
jgi:acyl-coenzyme A synthetase/AMP-(fatty) acid ligase